MHAEDVLAAYPDLPRKQRETAILQEHPAVFIYGIGWPLADGFRTSCARPTTTTGRPRRCRRTDGRCTG